MASDLFSNILSSAKDTARSAAESAMGTIRADLETRATNEVSRLLGGLNVDHVSPEGAASLAAPVGTVSSDAPAGVRADVTPQPVKDTPKGGMATSGALVGLAVAVGVGFLVFGGK